VLPARSDSFHDMPLLRHGFIRTCPANRGRLPSSCRGCLRAARHNLSCPLRLPPSAYRGRLHCISSPPRQGCVETVCCKHMFQVFQMYIVSVLYGRYKKSKIDPDVAYVAMVIHICYNCLFKIFHPFQTYVASVLSRYCIYVLHICCRDCIHICCRVCVGRA
jgi:hypothetical protein